MATPTLLVVDGNSLGHRAFHAYERTDMRRGDGAPCWAVYGFLALLAGICDKVKPTSLIVGFDDPDRSMRREAYPEYKAGRADKSDDLAPQLEDIISVLVDLGVDVVTPTGLEADDVCGSAAAAAEAAGWRCVIATSDRDAFALVSERTRVLRLGNGLDNATWVDARWLEEHYGIPASLVLAGGKVPAYTMFAALRGDSSDNLPGVKGIGEKTAAKILAAFGDPAEVFRDPNAAVDELGRANAKKFTDAAAAANYRRNLRIMGILRNLPMDVNAARLGARTRVEVDEVCRRWDVGAVSSRLAAALTAPQATAGMNAA